MIDGLPFQGTLSGSIYFLLDRYLSEEGTGRGLEGGEFWEGFWNKVPQLGSTVAH